VLCDLDRISTIRTEGTTNVTASNPPEPIITDQVITQCDDGWYRIGIDDEAPSFPSRNFAADVAASMKQRDPIRLTLCDYFRDC
jgi:hypothetical protein